ncbi:MAG: hypothetical protein AB1668_03605 [Nanoarchaeota archaeon]
MEILNISRLLIPITSTTTININHNSIKIVMPETSIKKSCLKRLK